MSQSEVSEEELLQRAGRGDARAFENLVERLAPGLFGLMRQLLPDEREAEEMLQEALAIAWERAPSYDAERSRAFPWLATHCRQRALERMRVLGRRTRLVEAAALEQTRLSGGNADAERADAIRAALDQLPKEDRQLIEFAFLKGVTHHVIADSLGVPLETVKTNIRRGLLRLRDLLKGAA